jgi:DNA-binding response OmpR family regulator
MSNIKIIDDDVGLAENLGVMLEHEGYKVSYRDTTSGAVEDLVRNKPDLLILDIMFPGSPCAGFDLAREIRRTPEVKDLPIILLTGLNQEFPMDFSSGDIDDDWMPVQDFIEKPVNIQELVKKIKEMT